MDPSRNIFWGLVVKPGKRYETEVQEPFRITKACLEPATAGGKVSSVFVECDNNEEFIIANLNAKNFNETIDLSFNEGEKICFKVDGPGTVHMTGNLLDDPPPDGMLGGDWSEEESEDSDDSVEESVVATGDKIKEVSEKEAKKILKRKTEVPKDGEKLKKAKLEEMDTTVDTSLGDLDDTDNFAEENDSDDDEDDSDEESESDDENTTVGDTTAEMADTTAASDEDEDSDDDSSEDEEEESKKSDSQPKEDQSPSKKKTADTTAACNGDVKTPKDKALETPKTSKDKKNKTPMPEGKTKDTEVTNGEHKTKKGGDAKTPKENIKTPKTDVKTPKEDVKTPKQEVKTPKQEAKTPKQEVKTPKDSQTPGKTPKRTLKGGVQVEDLKEGSGPECKPGNMVGMYYEGRLKSNNKKFDALKSGKPFKFKLGSGQVIKGWDVGVLGMKVGGKRKLTIPAQLGYGAQGAPPDIPGNATLVFDIECKFVK